MSKVLLQAKANITATTDNGGGSVTLGLNLTENNGVYNSLSVQAGDYLVISTGTFENGTYTRYIIDSVDGFTSATALTVTAHYDETNDNTAGIPDISYAFGYDCLLTRPTAKGFLPVPAPGFQAITDDFSEYVTNMNIVTLDAALDNAGGGVDQATVTSSINTALADYSTTVEMNTAINDAVTVATGGGITQTQVDSSIETALGDYYTANEVDAAISNVSVDLTGYATENYVDSSIAAIPATDLTGYATETYVGEQIAAIPATDLTAYSTTDEMNTAIGSVAQNTIDVSTNYTDNALANYSTTVEMNSAISTATTGLVSSTDLANAGYLTSETPDVVTSLTVNGDNTLTYTDEAGNDTVVDLSLYLDNVNLARITSGTLDSATGVATFTRDDTSTFTLDLSSLLNGTVSYNNLADIPTNLAKVDTYNSFTAVNDFQTDIRLFGNYTGTVDADGNSISSNDFIKWMKRTKDADTNLLTGGETLQTWMGVPNWDNGFFINGPDGNGGTQYSIRLTDTGDIWLHSGLDNNNPELIIEQGQVRSKGNFVAGGIFSGDGSGLTNLPQSDGFTYGTLKGLTTDDPTGNTYLGHEAGVYGSATQSVFLGLDAGRGKGAGSTANVAIGYGSLVDGGTQARQVAIGHMALRNAGFTGEAGSVTLMGQTEADYLASQAGDLNGVTIVAGGTGYTDGTYAVIATEQTNAGWNNVTAGSGLTLDVVTDGTGVITSVTINNAGSGYRTNEAVIIDGGDGNAAVIISSLVNTVASTSNVAIGFQAGTNAKTARNSVMIGNESGLYNWTGANNVFVGGASGREAYNINNSVGVGHHAGSGAAGNGNTFLGNYAGQTVRGNNNIMLGADAGKAYTDAVNSIVIGTQGNIPAGSREGVIEIGNSNNTRLYVPGVGIDIGGPSNEVKLGTADHERLYVPGAGLDTKLFHDLDNTTDQFMYYDASQQIFRPMEISIDGIEVSNAANTVTNLTSVKLMGGSTTTAQHDLLAFGGKMGFDAFTAEALRIDDDTWESTTLNNELFTGKKDHAIYVTENDTTYTHTGADGTLDGNPGGRSVVHKAWRLTVDSQGQLGYCNSKDIQIGVGYIPGGSMARVTIEYATTSDLANWITAAESDTYFGAAYLNFSTLTFGNYHGLRITIAPYQRISNTNGYGTFHPDSEGMWPVINISSIKMMTSRPGSQGSGPEKSFPYNWDSDKNILPGGAVRTAYLGDPGVTEVPSYSFVHDTNTGIGKAGSNSDGTVSVISNGVERVRFGNDQDAGAIAVIENDGRVRPVFHEGYMGPGTNLNADLLDSVQGADYISTSGWISGIDVTGTKYLPKANIGSIPDLNGAIEEGGVYSPFWGSDLGNVFARVGAYDAVNNPNGYIVTGIGTLPDANNLNAMVNAEANYGSINKDNFVTAGDTVVIEVPTNLQWSRPTVGITFGSNGTKADYLLVEVLQNGVWNTVSHWYDNGAKVYGALDSTSGKAINVQHSFVVPDVTQRVDRIRYTIGENPGGNGLRIVHLFAYKYNSKGLSNNFLSNNGGTVYGTTNFESTANVAGTFTVGDKLEYDVAADELTLTKAYRGTPGVFKGAFISDNGQDDGVIWPGISNDLGYRVEAGAALTVTNATINNPERLFNAYGKFNTITRSDFYEADGTTPRDVVIEMDFAGVGSALTYETRWGVQYHSDSFMPSYAKMEAFSVTNQAWELIFEDTNPTGQISTGTSPTVDAAGYTGVRVTLRHSGNANNVWIRKIWARNYASTGPEQLYVSREGGEVYGNVDVKASATIDETLTLGVLTAPPAAPVNGMIAIADGTTWDPAGTGTQSCVVYLAGNWVAMASA